MPGWGAKSGGATPNHLEVWVGSDGSPGRRGGMAMRHHACDGDPPPLPPRLRLICRRLSCRCRCFSSLSFGQCGASSSLPPCALDVLADCFRPALSNCKASTVLCGLAESSLLGSPYSIVQLRRSRTHSFAFYLPCLALIWKQGGWWAVCPFWPPAASSFSS
jgi:hypothetical protein